MVATHRCDSSQDSVVVTVDGSTSLLPPVNLSWNAAAGATGYTVEIATDAGFTTIVDSSTTASTGAAVSGPPFGTYFWRVSSNGTCAGAASATFSFSVSNAIFTDGFELGNANEWSAAVP